MVHFTVLLAMFSVFVDSPPPGRILATKTFRAAGVFAFYLHTLFGCPGFCILPTHTFGAILKQIEKNDFKFETFSALRSPFFSDNP